MCNKKLACVYCKELFVHRISDHLYSMHIEEHDVAKAFAHPPGSKKRKKAIEKIKNRGSFQHNIKILQGEISDYLIVCRRSSKIQKTAYKDEYLPCTTCYGFFLAVDLWRHYKICKHKELDDDDDDEREKNKESVTGLQAKAPACDRMEDKESGMGIQAKAYCMLKSALPPTENRDADELEPILSKMKKDEIYKACVQDKLILRLGLVLFRKLGIKRKNNIAQRMRQLGRLKIQMKITELAEVINGKCFDKLVSSMQELCEMQLSEEGLSIFGKPGLALGLGHNLKKVAHIKYGMALRADDDAEQRQAENCSKLLAQEWGDSVNSIALASLATNKFKKNELLPLTEDLVKLKDYADEEIDTLLDVITTKPEYSTWRALCEAIFVKLMVFNKRRSNEIEGILLSSFNARRNKADVMKEMVDMLSPLEKELFKR